MNRRKFLQWAGAGVVAASPVALMIDSILRSQTIGRNQPHNYVHFNFPGAPARWFFDLPLLPHEGAPFDSNPMVVTKFGPIGGHFTEIQTSYEKVLLSGIPMPWIWSYQVPDSGGGQSPLAELTKHLIMIRGCNMGLDGHDVNNARLVAPRTGDLSLTGLVADQSQALFPALSLGKGQVTFAYQSKSGKGQIILPDQSENYLLDLFGHLSRDKNSNFREKVELEKHINLALEAIDEWALHNHPERKSWAIDRLEAQKLIKLGHEGLRQEYARLKLKYDSLIDRVLHKSVFPGINDQKIPGVSFPFSAPKSLSQREIFGPLRYSHDGYLIGEDIRQLFSQAKLSHLASRFAVAEYLLTHQISNNIVLICGTLSHLTMSGFALAHNIHKTPAGPAIKYRYQKTHPLEGPHGTYPENVFSLDSHNYGTVPSLLGLSLFYLSLGTCLNEFVGQLKRHKIFQNTLIHLASEFGRNPRMAQDGSDHGWMGHSTSFLTGMTESPMVLGNIYTSTKYSNSTGHSGTWGEGAPVRGLESKVMEYGHITSTLASLLEVPTPTPNQPSLLKKERGRLVSQIEKAQNLEEGEVSS